MSEKPVWMETWRSAEHGVFSDEADGDVLVVARFAEGDHARSRLASAAPALVRALLVVEWNGGKQEPYDSMTDCCPECGGEPPHSEMVLGERRPDGSREVVRDDTGHVLHTEVPGVHEPACPLDAALTSAGFPTQESRDEARRMMAEAK